MIAGSVGDDELEFVVTQWMLDVRQKRRMTTHTTIIGSTGNRSNPS